MICGNDEDFYAVKTVSAINNKKLEERIKSLKSFGLKLFYILRFAVKMGRFVYSTCSQSLNKTRKQITDNNRYNQQNK